MLDRDLPKHVAREGGGAELTLGVADQLGLQRAKLTPVEARVIDGR